LRPTSLSELTSFRLAYVFNAFVRPDLQRAFKEWAALEFPEKWERVSKFKTSKTINGTDRIHIAAETLKA
jgi:hypothetical protein